jgi:hypothetical protein
LLVNLAAPADGASVLVHIDVVEGSGTPVTALSADELQVKIDGRPAALQGLRRAPSLAVMLVLDVSTRAIPYQEELRRGAERFAASLGPEDALGVVVYGAGVQRLLPLSTDHLETRRKLLSHHLQTVAPQRSTLWDAIVLAIGDLEGQPGRRTIVAFTQGFDDGSRASQRVVREAIQAAGARLDFFHAPRQREWSGGWWRQMLGELETPARDSGGSVVAVSEAADLVALFEQHVRLLRGSFELTLEVPPAARDAQPGKLQIRVLRKGAQVAAPAALRRLRTPAAASP